MRTNKFALAVLVLLIAQVGTASVVHSSDASDYRLGPQDKVRLHVFEWRPSRAEVYSWAPLNSEFTVSPAGTLSLPLVGNVKIASLTLRELEDFVSDQLKQKMGLVDRPATSAEVVVFRPFYITGDVANPGEYPFRPELTVLKALSLSGGLYRILGVNAASLERDATIARGDLRVMMAAQTSLLAKRARLKAEASGQPRIDFVTEAPGGGQSRDYTNAIKEEQMIFDLRRNFVRSKIESLNQGRALLEKEIATLTAKDASLAKQLALAISERDNVNALAGKGLVISTRQLSTEQAVAQMESARLDIGIARVRAEQDRAKLGREILELQDQRQAEILLELRLTEDKISEFREKSTTNERLIYNSETGTVLLEAENERDQAAVPTFVIVRAKAERTIEINASFATPLEPGDVVLVKKPAPLSINAALASHDSPQDRLKPAATAMKP